MIPDSKKRNFGAPQVDTHSRKDNQKKRMSVSVRWAVRSVMGTRRSFRCLWRPAPRALVQQPPRRWLSNGSNGSSNGSKSSTVNDTSMAATQNGGNSVKEEQTAVATESRTASLLEQLDASLDEEVALVAELGAHSSLSHAAQAEWAERMEALQRRLEAQRAALFDEARAIRRTPEWKEYKRVSDAAVAQLEQEFRDDPGPMSPEAIRAHHLRREQVVTEMQAHYREQLAQREALEAGDAVETLSAAGDEERVRALAEGREREAASGDDDDAELDELVRRLRSVEREHGARLRDAHNAVDETTARRRKWLSTPAVRRHRERKRTERVPEPDEVRALLREKVALGEAVTSLVEHWAGVLPKREVYHIRDQTLNELWEKHSADMFERRKAGATQREISEAYPFLNIPMRRKLGFSSGIKPATERVNRPRKWGRGKS